MLIADKKFILLLFIVLILGEVGWTYFDIGKQPSFWWLDNLLHFLGGVMAAGLILNFRPLADVLNNGTFVIKVLLLAALVLLVGVFWEFYEYAADYFFNRYLGNFFLGMTVMDTLSDLAFDLLGGGTAAVLYFNSRLYKESSLRT